ncbi:MAG TPA: tRNA uridine-5-carboxymethylaminomethyl(34) synthesis GTPase MnmE [Chitinophagaceae bacterium]|jgi:tRNA modification GTPase|nr:tRNA uridine-5-carboxymethylaminomethyl(34) synthesis GTPase MnmE [Chitinophagaceae bacterium]
MIGKLSDWDDTIVALATASGIGALGVIRLSGPSAVSIANQLFPSKDLSVQPSHSLHVGLLKIDGEILDEVVVSLYHAPKSYTGEDVVEISCHGSPHIEEKIIAACVVLGARLARAGEFTQRAFLKGKMDLTQAEAVADLIASHSEAARVTALHTMRGGFAADLRSLREQLLGFSALIELELDFSQEDVEFADRKKFYTLIEEMQRVTSALVESFKYGNVIRNGVHVAIVGKPNAGKSTLLNSLLNEQRAIVSEIAGTTRDTIEELLVIEGIEFRLIDTAGIRAHTTDTIEQLGMDKTREKIEHADIVLEILDATEPLRENIDIDPAKLIRVLNKTDLFTESAYHLHATPEIADREGSGVRNGLTEFRNTEIEFMYDASRRRDSSLHARFPDKDLIFISAKTSQGVDQLKRALVDRVLEGKSIREGTVVTNARHHHALVMVAIALGEIRSGLNSGIPGDLLSLDIRRALHFLGEITGEVTSEEQLSWIFGKFCIGK